MLNFFRLTLTLAFRLIFWLLITSNFNASNILIGLVVSLVIPFGTYKSLQLKAILPSVFNILKTVPKLFSETLQLMLIKRPKDVFIVEPMSPSSIKGSKLAQFIQVIAITSTPMSLVVGKKDDTNWSVHTVSNKRSS